MGASWTRRALLLSLPAPLLATRGQVFPPERTRYADGATELEVNRLTSPEHQSFLPAPHARSASSRGGFLIYSSDRGGSLQVCRMDIRSGESRILTEASQLLPDSVTMLADEKSAVYFDGQTLKLAQTGGGSRDRELYTCDSGGSFAAGLSSSDDGLQAAFMVRNGSKATLMYVATNKAGAQKIVDVPPEASLPLLRPRRAAVLYRTADSLWLVSFDGQENRRLKTPPGEIRAPQWSPDGRSILYLLGTELREHTPDTNSDTSVAKTSQFGTFGRNADASVFVGASKSLAQPYVLLMLRITRRELAICEHRCSNPLLVNPVFAPSSQRIYFQSDQGGKMAIYTMAVERLVEKTES